MRLTEAAGAGRGGPCLCQEDEQLIWEEGSLGKLLGTLKYITSAWNRGGLEASMGHRYKSSEPCVSFAGGKGSRSSVDENRFHRLPGNASFYPTSTNHAELTGPRLNFGVSKYVCLPFRGVEMGYLTVNVVVYSQSYSGG